MSESVAIIPLTKAYGGWYQSSAAEASSQVAAASVDGVLNTLIISNSNAAARYAWVTTGAVAGAGTQVVAPILIPIGASVVLTFPVAIPFVGGLIVASSSTQATFTAATADFRVTAGYGKTAKMA